MIVLGLSCLLSPHGLQSTRPLFLTMWSRAAQGPPKLRLMMQARSIALNFFSAAKRFFSNKAECSGGKARVSCLHYVLHTMMRLNLLYSLLLMQVTLGKSCKIFFTCWSTSTWLPWLACCFLSSTASLFESASKNSLHNSPLGGFQQENPSQNLHCVCKKLSTKVGIWWKWHWLAKHGGMTRFATTIFPSLHKSAQP